MATPSVPFPQRGEVASLIRGRDWGASALGEHGGWPASLATILNVMLTSRYAMWLGWGPELTMFYNDTYAEQTLGKKHPWALGRSAREVWAEIWSQLNPRIEQVLSTGEATWDEGLLLFLERNGYPEETYHTFSYSPLPTDGGQIGGMFCVVIEETERVISERRMRLLRDLAAAFSNTTTTADVLAATEQSLAADDGAIPFALVYLADEAEVATLGARTHLPAEHRGAPPVIALDDGRAPWPIAQVLDSGEGRLVDLHPERAWPQGPWPQAPGRALVLPMAAQPDARPIGAVVLALNPHRPFDDGYRAFLELVAGQITTAIASARSHEAERRRAEALAELDRAKTAFFSNVSHEFRTPLTLMLGPTEDALASVDRALRGEDLEIVHRNELRLLKLVNTLLDFSRIEAGRVQARYEEIDVAALTAELASVFRSAIERAGLTLRVEAATPIRAFVDREMWEKIVLNLLSNALKFTFEGGITVEVSEVPGEVVVSVRDTGTGVSDAEVPHLFERFHRVEGARARTHEGSGIGLALVAELVKLHGGEVDVESELGVGTSFSIRVPTGSAHLPADRIEAPRQAGGATTRAAPFVQEALRWTAGATVTASTPGPEGPAARARILLADDNADMRGYVARLLGDHWTVTTVSDGAAALERLSREPFDLVISDVMMPQIDGIELVRAVRQEPVIAATPIILLSARAGEEAIADGLRSGADDYLVKPFSASALLVRVEAQLAAARGREELRRHIESERERLRALFDVSPAALAIVRGDDLVIELANPNMLELWGVDERALGKPLLEAVPVLAGQGFDDLLRGVLRSGQPHRGTAVRARIDRRGSGELVDAYFDFVYAPMTEARGRGDGVLIHSFEVTELVEQRRAAEQANRMKDEFLATMSHELRTPLNAILGWAAMLRGPGHAETVKTKALATIERNARAQARLIDDILDVSRIVSGKLRLTLDAVDVAAVVNAALDVVRPAMLAKGVELRADVGECGFLTADADRLQQVVWNLLINAVRFTPPGGTIDVVAGRSDSNVRIVVKDSGAGIPSEHVAHVFERFRQVDSSTTRKHGGLGLGLAIVRHVVELHGGVVSAESAGPDRGATFTVSLPVRAVLVTDTGDRIDEERLHRGSGAARARALDGIDVLVAEDDADSRELVESLLTAAGARVTTAASAAEAFERLVAKPPGVLISDIGMPGEDGYALMRRVCALPADHPARSVRAIALTAYARKEDERLALAAGYHRHLAKPVEPALLLEVVADIARGRAPE